MIPMYKLPDLPYSYNALEPWIDEATMKIHHDKHHAGYVDNLNKLLEGNNKLGKLSIEELMKDFGSIPKEIRSKVKNNAGGHFNHTFFWNIMGPGENRPQGELADNISSTFTNFNTFKEKFSQAGVNRFGSGWAWLVLNDEVLEIIDTPNQDSPVSDGLIPLLCLDVWEHAYYLKYQNRRVDYINAWWNVVNWKAVEKLYEVAKN